MDEMFDLVTGICKTLEARFGFPVSFDEGDRTFTINLSLEGVVNEVDLVIDYMNESEGHLFISSANILADVQNEDMMLQLSYFLKFAELMCPGGNFSIDENLGLIFYTIHSNENEIETALEKGIKLTKAMFERFGVGLIAIVYGGFSCDKAVDECRVKWGSRNQKTWIMSLIDFSNEQEEERENESEPPSLEDSSTGEDDMDLDPEESYSYETRLNLMEESFGIQMILDGHESAFEQSDKEDKFTRYLLKAIETYLKLYDFNEDINEDERYINFKVVSKTLFRRVEVEISIEESVYTVFVALPIVVNLENEEQVRRLTEFICRVNEHEPLVKFLLNMDTGMFLTSVRVDCSGVKPTFRLLHKTIFTELVTVIDRHAVGILEILYTDTSAEAAYAKCIN